MKLLHVIADPSPLEQAVDKQLAQAFLDALDEDDAITVEEIDLYADPPPYFDLPTLRYFWQRYADPAYEPTTEERAAAEYARRHCALFRDTNVVALTAPMWNASVPAILKAWIDQVICPGETYRFSERGPEGMHAVERICVFTQSSGAYTIGEPRDCLTNLVRAAFKFIGIDQIDVVWADGQSRSIYDDADARKDAAIARARALGATLTST